VFTGLVQQIGEVVEITSGTDATTKLVITAPMFAGEIKDGESIAISGVCLTVSGHQPDASRIEVEVMGETLARTSLANIKTGVRVNLERALLATDRLGGHIVQGHIDTTASLLAKRTEPNWHVLRFELAPSSGRYVIEKGSIAIDGVSLTVSNVDKSGEPPWFEVSLIPTTLATTTLSDLEPGQIVNLEFDVLAKYAESMLQPGN
jgi:riboflavin synthase